VNYKPYENFFATQLFSIFFIIIFVFALYFFFRFSSFSYYQMISGVVFSKNRVVVLLTSKELSWFYRNKNVLIDGEKKSFVIDTVYRDYMKQKKKTYHQVVLQIPLSDYAENDSILLGIQPQKKSFSFLFFNIWKGG
jgi:hypothetical protein